MEGSLAEAQA
jgi:hypothetical protein